MTHDAVAGDLVYFDPPYTVAHGNNGFVKYNEKIFQWADQVRLARVFAALANRGCRVFLSNADHRSVRKLYNGYRVATLHRYSGVEFAIRIPPPSLRDPHFHPLDHDRQSFESRSAKRRFVAGSSSASGQRQ